MYPTLQTKYMDNLELELEDGLVGMVEDKLQLFDTLKKIRKQ